MLSIVISVIALGVLITIHELGHYLAAKACGVAVIEFSIGMGPRIFSIVKGNTRYSLRILPFGGSCMMLGEELEEETGKAVGEAAGSASESAESQESTEYRSEEAEGHGAILIDERSYRASEQFVNKPAWSRFIIIAAGPVFNFLLAFGLSLIITGTVGFDKPVITAVTPNMPAAEAGIEAGDMIYAMSAAGDRVVIETARDINLFTALHREAAESEQEFVVYYRDASDNMKKKAASVVPRYSSDTDSKRIGFAYSLAYRKTEGAADALLCSIYNVRYGLRTVAESLKMLAGGKVGRRDVMGPVRMVAVMDESVDEASDHGAAAAALTLFDMMILISVSLGAMNLLPLPALDGGRLLFILIELLTRRAVPKELEARIHTVGMLLLLALMVFIMTNDISLLIFS